MLHRSPSALALAAAALLACHEPAPQVGPRKVRVPVGTDPAPALALTLEAAAVDAVTLKTSVDFRVTLGADPVALADLAALAPRFTLAELVADPDSGIPAWRSQVATGSQTVPAAPLGGPGTTVEPAHAQPGADACGVTEDLGDGLFRCTFATALPASPDPTHTFRVGAWLNGVATGTEDTCATLDFLTSGGTAAGRDLAVDDDCLRCHERVIAHGRRVGVRLCLTCHTTQAADPDTADPAASLSATGATNPNPLDLGRLVHRIHRGRNLPTLYQSSSATAAPALGSGALPLPFNPGRNAPAAGRAFTLVGYQGRAFTFGLVKTWSAPGQADRTVAAGISFPRDGRDCMACHEHGPQGGDDGLTFSLVSRRVCSGCHPDVWFGPGAPPDAAHFAHPGGPQADDSLCRECHVSGTVATPPRKAYVDVKASHAPPTASAPFSKITATITSVSGFLPGQLPTVTFRLDDRTGPISPLNDAANPPPPDAATPPSPVARWPAGSAHRLAFVISGPTCPDYATANSPLTETVNDVLTADATGTFTYTFKAVRVPDAAAGSWAVALEARRQLSPRSPFYDPATDAFSWPYTAEALTEHSTNPVVYVQVIGGSMQQARPRRTVVTQARCNACHGELLLHGGNRSTLTGCLACHAPDQSDWGRRPKDAAGNVTIASTYDGVEERSVHFKMLIHRIHTGGRTGSAQIDLQPFVVYAYGGIPTFFEETFPGDLANCRTCHEGESFLLESIPASAAATRVNENSTVLHQGTATHGTGEPLVPAMTAACTSCHDTATARLHAAAGVVNGAEACVGCHGAHGTKSVYAVHGLAAP